MPGPVPNRTEDLARPRERKGSDIQSVTKGKARDVVVPRVSDREWHPIAKRVWDAAKTSGQSDFYQNSDWAILYSLCDDLSHYKKSGNRSSVMLAAIMSGLTNLLLTEGDRRRARLELEAEVPDEQDAELFAIDGYRDMLGAAGQAGEK